MNANRLYDNLTSGEIADHNQEACERIAGLISRSEHDGTLTSLIIRNDLIAISLRLNQLLELIENENKTSV